MPRGRKPIPCPVNAAELRRVIEGGDFIGDAARHYNVARKTLYRWMTEYGFKIPEPRKQRARDVVPRYVRTARLPDGKRINPRLYSVWINMIKRCYSPSNVNYRWYGLRGITVCDAWRDYDNFRAWAILAGFCKDITLDRIDSNGNYEPSNCRWADRDVQQQNKRRAGPLPGGIHV
jgi:hypothetical protein